MDQERQSRFLLDPEQTEHEKRLRERQFHAIDVPRLRILGLVILTLLVIFHKVFTSGETDWRLPLRIAVVLFSYALASWAVLYFFFENLNRMLPAAI